MILLRKLFRGQLVELDHFGGKFGSLLKAFAEEHDFCDQLVIRDHHGNWSEEHLEIIRELHSAFVTGIHCDKNSTVLLENSIFAIEEEFLLLRDFGLLDVDELLSNYRKNFRIDPIELVETAPSSCLDETREELGQHLVLELAAAIIRRAESAASFSQILRAFRLSCACRSRWSSPELDICMAPVIEIQHLSVSCVIIH